MVRIHVHSQVSGGGPWRQTRNEDGESNVKVMHDSHQHQVSRNRRTDCNRKNRNK